MRLQRRSIEIITPPTPPFIPSEGCVRRAEVGVTHFRTVTRFISPSFGLKINMKIVFSFAGEEGISLSFFAFLAFLIFALFIYFYARRVSCLAMSHRVVLSRVTDHVQLRHLGLTVCSVVHAKIRPRSWQARESHKIIRIYVDDYCIECISIISAVL